MSQKSDEEIIMTKVAFIMGSPPTQINCLRPVRLVGDLSVGSLNCESCYYCSFYWLTFLSCTKISICPYLKLMQRKLFFWIFLTFYQKSILLFSSFDNLVHTLFLLSPPLFECLPLGSSPLPTSLFPHWVFFVCGGKTRPRSRIHSGPNELANFSYCQPPFSVFSNSM